MARTETVVTSQLRTGDRVYAGIGIVRLTGDIRTIVDPTRPGMPVTRIDGTVEGFSPDTNVNHAWLRGINAGYEPSDSWAIQGNDYARWTRILPVSLVKA